MRVTKWERSRSHLSFYKQNGSGSDLLPFLVKIVIPSKNDYRAVFIGFMFYTVKFTMKRLSLIVGHSDSLTAQITRCKKHLHQLSVIPWQIGSVISIFHSTRLILPVCFPKGLNIPVKGKHHLTHRPAAVLGDLRENV